MNRLIELTGWIVLAVSVILLGVANHIDNYQPPEPVAAGRRNKHPQPFIARQLTLVVAGFAGKRSLSVKKSELCRIPLRCILPAIAKRVTLAEAAHSACFFTGMNTLLTFARKSAFTCARCLFLYFLLRWYYFINMDLHL